VTCPSGSRTISEKVCGLILIEYPAVLAGHFEVISE
jgi:hypothetical protein